MGRLIDADSLDITTITTDDYSGNEILDVVLKEDIDDAPTVDAIPKSVLEDIRAEFDTMPCHTHRVEGLDAPVAVLSKGEIEEVLNKYISKYSKSEKSYS